MRYEPVSTVQHVLRHGLSWSRLLALASIVLAAAVTRAEPPSGGGSIDLPLDRIDATERARIRAALSESRTALVERGLLPADRRLAKGARPELLWPVTSQDPELGRDAISNFVDHDPVAPGALLDYACGDRSYDLESGYNHQGTDIFGWPFRWRLMEDDVMVVRAAAPGRIVLKQDGNPDRNCSFGAGSWNAVFVEHDDGSTAWYGHFKTGTVTSKAVGDRVAAGELLGVIGSSGSSTAPHLHFELYDAFDQLVDPFAGPCNRLNPESWWLDQPPYRVTRVHRVATHVAPPDFGTCPDIEEPNFSDHFDRGQAAIFAAYFRDLLDSSVVTYEILRPDGSTFRAWEHSPPESARSSYWWWTRTLPEDAAAGRWTFRVMLEEQVEEAFFEVAVRVFGDGFEVAADAARRGSEGHARPDGR